MSGPAIDAAHVIADLRELARRTANERGAQRVAWTPTWEKARAFLAELVGELGLQLERDAAGNNWASIPGDSEQALVVGSHIDSVPDGGWLDGALGVMAAIGVLRAWARSGETPAKTLTLVDWADEEGARFGLSLYGSSAFSGTLDTAAAARLTDAGDERMDDVLAANGVELGRAPDAGARREGIAAYLELHIEQGPVLEADGLGAAAVEGCVGIERHRLIFTGQAGHAGTTPMLRRLDAGLAAAETALRVEAVGRDADGMATTGSLTMEPGIATAVAGRAELVADLRHADAARLAAMLDDALTAARDVAGARGCKVAAERIWGIEPVRFDPGLVELAADAVREATGSERRMTSGALHDAAEVARVLPAAMIFVPSIAGISHAKEEDTAEEDLARGIEAFGALADRVLASLA